MTSNSRLDAVDPHTYGQRAAAACDPLIAQIEAASIPEAIAIIDRILDPQMRNRAMAAFINYTSTGNRETLAESIKGYEYLAAHLHLGQHMHALRMIDELNQMLDFPKEPVIDEMPIYPVSDENYQLTIASITETLTESIQASNAPSAAISAATCSI